MVIDWEIFFNEVCVSILLPFTCAIALDKELFSAYVYVDPIPLALTSIYSIELANVDFEFIRNIRKIAKKYFIIKFQLYLLHHQILLVFPTLD